MKNFLRHFFIPHERNNHRAFLLHHKTILAFILFLFTLQFFISYGSTRYPSVLGASIDITSPQLLLLTNQKRIDVGLPALTYNETLANAATLKADDMFSRNYWAHNAPDGTTPWVFIKKAGYTYVYAGENLARGFSSTSDVVDAWMASPSHKENLLSENYTEVGFAVKRGKLLGEDTILVVQMFGSRNIPLAVKNTGEKQETVAVSGNGQENTQTLGKQLSSVLHPTMDEQIQIRPLVNTYTLSRTIVIGILLLFLFALFLDMILIERKKVVRFVGHNIDHIFFFLALLIFILINTKGLVI